MTGEAWTPASSASDPVVRQRLRDEIDALVAHHYGLSRAEFAHILDAFPLVPLTRQTFVLAAQMRTDCRRRGVQAGSVDFLIAAACVEAGFPLLAADEDFARIARCTDLILVPVQVD